MFKILICIMVLAACFRAEAVIVYGTNGTGTNNTSAPADDPGWANVGTVGGSTTVYLGSQTTGYWMLTANHVDLSGGTVSLNGGTYNIVGASIKQIVTADPVPVPIDLKVFRLQTNPGLSGVTISSSAPSPGSSVVMIGNGRDRGAITTWDGNPTGWGSSGSAASGYVWGSNQIVRWGSNVVQDTNLGVYSGATTFSTIFNDTSNPNEAQASLGDSGGGVFVKNGGLWELTGIMLTVGVWDGISGGYYGQFTGQPSNTSLITANTGYSGAGSATFSAQLSDYRTLILDAIPEPSISALSVFALFAILVVRRTVRQTTQNR